MKKSVLHDGSLLPSPCLLALQRRPQDVAKSSLAITFRPTVGLNSRGAEVTTENLRISGLSAWTDADNVFTDELFVKKDGTTEFHCDKDEPYYWEKNKNYTFVSFATGKADKGGLTPTVDKTGITLNDYAPDKDPANHMDLLAA